MNIKYIFLSINFLSATVLINGMDPSKKREETFKERLAKHTIKNPNSSERTVRAPKEEPDLSGPLPDVNAIKALLFQGKIPAGTELLPQKK